MKITFFITILIISLINAQEVKNGVYQLTSSNFEEFIKANNHVLVKFYAPWCQQSQKLAPQFQQAAETLSKKKIILAEVDCTKETNLAEGLMIDNYPTLLYFRKQKLIEYNGGKTSQEIESWCEKKLFPPVTLVRSIEELQEHQKNKENVIVLYFGEINTNDYQEYEETVHLFNNENLKFLSTPNLMNRFNIEQIPSIILLKQFDENRIDYQEKINSIDLKTFIIKNMFSRVVKLSETTAEHIFNDNNPIIFIYLRNRSSLTNQEETALNFFYEISTQVNNQLMMSECDFSNEICSRIAEFTGISLQIHNTPLFQILDPRGPIIKKYLFQGEITIENLKVFINSFENDKLQPYYKSQEIPENNQKNKIKTIVSKNFINEVIKTNKHVIVNFYAEWCSKSQQFKPIYEKVAELISEELGLIFTQIEASENEVPDLEIDFFPTIMLYKADDKSNPIQFKGEKLLDQFMDFIKTNLKQDKNGEEKNDL